MRQVETDKMATLTEDQQSAFNAIINNPRDGGAIHIDGGAGAGKSFLIEKGEFQCPTEFQPTNELHLVCDLFSVCTVQ